MAKWTMQHEDGSQIQIPSTVSLRIARESGYQWVNKNDGQGWQQLSLLLRREAVRRAVAA